MIQISQNKTSIINQDNLDKLKKIFEKEHVIVLQDLLAPSLRGFIEMQFQKADYLKKTHVGKENYIIGEEFVLNKQSMLYSMFLLLMNTNEYLDAIRYITGLDNIKSFSGRIYKLDASDDCFDNWHNDIVSKEGRLVGLSLNLSSNSYEGGHFMIKEKNQENIIKEISYKDWGSAHIFRIDKKLVHKVSKVTGEVPRIAYAGWFMSEIGFKDYLNNS